MFKKFFYKYVLRRKYYRYGHCLRCGDCCSKIYVNHCGKILKAVADFEKLKKLHPFYTYIEIVDSDENGLVFKCNNFDKAKHICKIHKSRPGICRRYPSEKILNMKAVMSENCGFRFKPIESFQSVLEKMKKKS